MPHFHPTNNPFAELQRQINYINYRMDALGQGSAAGGSAPLDSSPVQNSTHGITSGGVYTALQGKVSVQIGLGLSSNDYTTLEKQKLAGVATGATANQADSFLLDRANHTGSQGAATIVQDSAHRFVSDAQIIQWNAASGGAGSIFTGTAGQYVKGDGSYGSLSAVATSGDYADLSGKPTLPVVPTLVSAFTNDAGYQTTAAANSQYVPLGRTLTINGVTWDLSANRSWTISTVSGETDPIFSASAAFNITSTQITHWDNAYAWGNHAGLYPLITGAYSNPAWITSLAYSKLSGAPLLATVATSGAYLDLTGRPTIYAFSGLATQYTKGDGTYGTLAAVATSGAYSDLSGKPTIPTNTNQLTNGAGFLTAETDPVFLASPAAGIQASDISGWNGAKTFVASFNLGTPSNGQVIKFNSTSGKWEPGTDNTGGTGGITTLNTLSDAVQTFAVGTAGTDVGVSSASGVHTFNFPDASATARGLVTTGTQTIAGTKTFANAVVLSNGFQTYGVTGNGSNMYVPTNTSVVSITVPQYQATAATTIGTRRGFRGQTNPVMGVGVDYIGTAFGQEAATIAASGTHNLFATAAFSAPAITTGAGTLLEAATVFIKDAPTLGTNKYALHVASGLSRLDGGLKLGAGTTTQAPLQYTSGSLLSALQDGSMEYDGTHLYFTIGATRYQMDRQSGSISAPANQVVFGTGSATSSSALFTFTSGQLLLTGDTSSAAVGPFTIASNGATNTIGTAITLDASATGGHKYSFISTGSGAGIGAGGFAVYDGTADKYVLSINSAAHVLIGTNTDIGGTFMLQVTGSAYINGTLSVQNGTLLPPKYNSSQIAALTSVFEGALVYNTDTHKLLTYSGTTWLAAGGNAQPNEVQLSSFSPVLDGTTDNSTVLANALAAIPATGGTLRLPYGTVYINTAVTIPPNVKIMGQDKFGSSIIKFGDNGQFILKSYTTLTQIAFTGTVFTHAITLYNQTAQHDINIEYCSFNTMHTAFTVAATVDNSIHFGFNLSNNRFDNLGSYGLYAIKMNSAIIYNNYFQCYSTTRAIAFSAGNYNRIFGNTINYGITGIAFVYDFAASQDTGMVGNIIDGNHIKYVTEESISFDSRGDFPTSSAVREFASIVTKTTSSGSYIVTLSSAFSTSGGALQNQYFCFYSGALKGQVAKILNHSGITFYLELDPEQYGLLTVGDQVVIGMPAYNNKITNNDILIDPNAATANLTTTPIILWGLAYKNIISGNTIENKSNLDRMRLIKLSSLNGLDATGGYTSPTDGRKAPVENNIVMGNTLVKGDIRIELANYGTTTFSSKGNQVLGNNVSGQIYMEYNEDNAVGNVASMGTLYGAGMTSNQKKTPITSPGGLLYYLTADESGNLSITLDSQFQNNLFQNTEALDNAYWVKTNATVSANSTNNYAGVQTADELVDTTATGKHCVATTLSKASGAKQYQLSVDYKLAGSVASLTLLAESSSGNYCYVSFDGTGTVTNSGNQVFTLQSNTAVSLGGGWYRATVLFTSDGVTDLTTTFQMGNSSSGGTTYTGTGSSGCYLTRMQLSQSATALPYNKN